MTAKAETKTNQITEGVIWKQLLIFFFPILFGTFFQQLYNTADAMIVGHFVGKQALAAVGGTTGTIINLLPAARPLSSRSTTAADRSRKSTGPYIPR